MVLPGFYLCVTWQGWEILDVADDTAERRSAEKEKAKVDSAQPNDSRPRLIHCSLCSDPLSGSYARHADLHSQLNMVQEQRAHYTARLDLYRHLGQIRLLETTPIMTNMEACLARLSATPSDVIQDHIHAVKTRSVPENGLYGYPREGQGLFVFDCASGLLCFSQSVVCPSGSSNLLLYTLASFLQFPFDSS